MHFQPNAPNTGVQKCIQHKWNFVHTITPDVGPLFGNVEEDLLQGFLPELLVDMDWDMMVW